MPDRLPEATSKAEHALYGRERALCAELARLESELAAVVSIDPTLGPLTARLGSARVDLEDLAGELGRYARKVDGDPEQLAQVRSGSTPSAVSRSGTVATWTWSSRSGSRQTPSSPSSRMPRPTSPNAPPRPRGPASSRGEVAQSLSEVRRAAAASLGSAIGVQLGDLGMGGAEIVVDVAPSSPEPQGWSTRGCG